MDIMQAVYTLVNSLVVSPEFSALQSAKAVINSNPELKRQLDAFQSAQARLYSDGLNEQQAQMLMTEVERSYGELMKIQEFRAFFMAGDSFSNLIDSIVKFINDSLEKQIV